MRLQVKNHRLAPPSFGWKVFTEKNTKLKKCEGNSVLEIPKQFSDVIESCSINLKNCTAFPSLHTLVLVDKKQSTVYRLSLSEYGKKLIENNYEIIGRYKNLGLPETINFNDINEICALSSEVMISGAAKELSLVSDKVIENIFVSMIPIYVFSKKIVNNPSKNVLELLRTAISMRDSKTIDPLSKVVSKWGKSFESLNKRLFTSQIHGDLTHENVVFDKNGKVRLIDFERSHHGFVEFDIWLLFGFVQVRKMKLNNYLDMFDYLETNEERIVTNHSMNIFLENLPKLKMNVPYYKMIYKLFLIYIGLLTLINTEDNDEGRKKMIQKVANI